MKNSLNLILAAAGFVRQRIQSQTKERPTKRDCYTGECTCTFANALRLDPPPSVMRAAIYTPTDGVVDWRSCIEEDESLNTKVSGTHAGLAFNPQVFRRVADLLAVASRTSKNGRKKSA